MRKNENFVTDTELQAYFNNELGDVRQIYVEAYLDRHPQESVRILVGAYQDKHPEEAVKLQKHLEVSAGLHSTNTSTNEVTQKEPVQETAELPEPVKDYRFYLPRILKVAVLTSFMTMIITGGWIAHAQWGDSSDSLGLDFVHLLRPATFAHNMYSTDPEYPVEFKAEKKELLSNWLSVRMNASIWAPSLSNLGYKLIGGRLIPSTNRMAAQFMYENTNRERITVYVRRDDWGARETRLQYRGLDGVKTYFWSDGEMGYAVIGTINKTRLIAAAQKVNDTFSNI